MPRCSPTLCVSGTPLFSPSQGTTSASAAAALKGTYPSVTAAVSNAGWSATPGQTQQAPPRSVGPLSWKPAPGHLTQGTSVSSVGSVSAHMHTHARTHTHTVLYEVITASSPCVFTLKQVHVCVCPVCLSGHPSCLLRHSAGVHSQDAIPAGSPATAHGHRWGQDREEALLGPATLPPGVLSPGVTGERRVRHCRDV